MFALQQACFNILGQNTHQEHIRSFRDEMTEDLRILQGNADITAGCVRFAGNLLNHGIEVWDISFGNLVHSRVFTRLESSLMIRLHRRAKLGLHVLVHRQEFQTPASGNGGCIVASNQEAEKLVLDLRGLDVRLTVFLSCQLDFSLDDEVHCGFDLAVVVGFSGEFLPGFVEAGLDEVILSISKSAWIVTDQEPGPKLRNFVQVALNTYLVLHSAPQSWVELECEPVMLTRERRVHGDFN